MWNPKNPSVANVEKLKRKIDKLRKGTIVRLGGMTDCFQPIELDNRITYKIIKYLNKRRIGYLIVTKSSIVANDEYLKIYDKDLAHFQITVTTTDDSKSVKYEKATVPSKRIEAIEKLYKNGFDVQVRLSPFIYEYIDFDILNNIKCKVNTKYWYSTSVATGDGTYRDYLEESLQRAQIPVRAIMGRSAISVNDFIHLQPGDIIKVNTRLEDELDVYVGNIKKFSAIPGAYEDSYAVKIKSIYREE